MTTIPRLQRLVELVDKNGYPSVAFHIWWDQVAAAIETQFADILAAQTDIFEALSSMPDIPNITITADYTGTVDAGQLPLTISAQRFSGTTDNTLDAVWSFTVDSGDLTATITNGDLTITALGATSVVTITSVYNSVTKSRSFTANKSIAAPPATGSTGGTSAQDTSFATINSNVHAAISDELQVTVAPSGNVVLSAPLTVTTDTTGSAATYRVYGKWQWWNGAAWVDLAAEVPSVPDCSIDTKHRRRNGTLNVPDSKTGLTPASLQKFRLMARNNSGTQVMSFSGTASAVSS